jgi:hypothetical protein
MMMMMRALVWYWHLVENNEQRALSSAQNHGRDVWKNDGVKSQE